MSWTATLHHTPVTAHDIDHDAFRIDGYDTMAPEQREQIDEALRAVQDLACSGAFGDPDHPDTRFHIALYGHANPGHQQPETGPNDTVTVTVARWHLGG